MMDWNLILLEPNLQFTSELSENLRTNYFQRYEKAKQSLENFSSSLLNAAIDYRKLLLENLELSSLNEKFKQVIDDQPTQPRIAKIIDEPCSEILGASPNCKLDRFTKVKTDNAVNHKNRTQEIIEQKENINDFVAIFSSDFNDLEDETFGNYKSPSPTVLNTPEKVQNSPILSKRKRFNSKKNSSSTSNNSSNSITSSNDSKINITTTPNLLEINVDERDINYGKESRKEDKKEPLKEIKKKLEDGFKNEPLKTIENTFTSIAPKYNNNKTYNVLGVSNCGRTEFGNKGKKFRQTTLTLKKMIPVIDISKVDSQGSLNNEKSEFKSEVDDSWDETFFENDNTYTRKGKNNKGDILNVKKESTDQKKINQAKKSQAESLDISMKNDELIEISPAQSEKSKLRNKLSLKRAGIEKVKSLNAISSESPSSFKEKSNSNSNQYEVKHVIHEINKKSQNNAENYNILKPSTSKEDNVKKRFDAEAIEGKLLKPQRSLSDDTYFSPAERSKNRNDLEDYELDISEFEDEIKYESPPAKKMLMDSYDMVPGRYEKSPDFAYKEGPIRNKNERAQLQGWCCRDCKEYYKDLPPEEKQKKLNECSRHRGRHNVDPLTPESFWNPGFEVSYDSTCE